MTEKGVVYEFTFPSIHRELIRFMDFFLFPFLLAPIAVLGFTYLRTGKNLMLIVGFLINIPVYLVVRWWVVRSKLFTSPQKVKVGEEKLVLERWKYRTEYSLRNLKALTFALYDKGFFLTANVGWVGGWSLSFLTFPILGDENKFREFYSKTYPEFKMVLEERARHLNPGVKIEVKDKRKKFRG
ncbi:MAG: hypothetical protein DRN28_05075 [Thermoplasmata archaeon]|nr:MAG: hypothetical protein DRN28_05075 [Thermoplasmata archaeon]